jgi:cell fate (sporulation/competence/biofilm development) regulator YlbF (YheA/YmcA/DUF963 family)
MDGIAEKARELGRLLGQSPEHQALERARQRIHEDRDLTQTINRLASLEADITAALHRGEEPADTLKLAYEREFTALQGSPVYQSFVAAQTNFEKLFARVNEQINLGMETGSQSRIILPT